MLFDDEPDSKTVVRSDGGSLPAVMFHLTPRRALGLSYSMLTTTEMTEDRTLVLSFGRHTITMQGTCLDRLHEDLLLRKVLHVSVSPRAELLEASPGCELIITLSHETS